MDLGLLAGSALMDISTFYDSIPLLPLIDDALELGHHPCMLQMVILVYASSRIPRTLDAVNEPVDPTCSIVAGESATNGMGRCISPCRAEIGGQPNSPVLSAFLSGRRIPVHGGEEG